LGLGTAGRKIGQAPGKRSRGKGNKSGGRRIIRVGVEYEGQRKRNPRRRATEMLLGISVAKEILRGK
jgi:hypothetical protein